MSDESTLWVLRTPAGQLKGPFSTEKVKRLILDGSFTGSEFIAKYPEGSWGELTKRSEFYDTLMQALESPIQSDPNVEKKMNAETQVTKQISRQTIESDQPQKIEPPVAEEVDDAILEKFEKDDSENKNEVHFNRSQLKADLKAKVPVHQRTLKVANSQQSFENLPELPIEVPASKNKGNGLQTSTNEDIVLTQGIKSKPKAILNSLFLIIIGVVVGAYLFNEFFLKDAQTKAGIVLISPKKPVNKLSQAQVNAKISEAAKFYFAGGLNSLLKAENVLISTIENETYSVETRSLLCMVYKELWPFTNQDALNTKAIVLVMQQSRTVNPASPYTKLCEVVLLMSSGRLKEAKGMIESTLENLGTMTYKMNAAMYFLKAEILEAEQNLDNAHAYYDSALKMWPDWVEASVATARVFFKRKKFVEANEVLNLAQKSYPQSKALKIWAGIINHRGFMKPEIAMARFAEGFAIKDRVPNLLEAMGRFYYADALLSAGKQSDSIKQAEMALRLNPMNSDYRNLVLRLGGNSSVEGQSMASMLIIGDQYMNAGEYLAAQAEYKAAYELNPKNAMAAFKAAKCLWQLNQTTEAVDWLDKAIRSDSKFISAHILKAEYLSEAYDFVAATGMLSAAQKIDPNSYEVSKGFAKLELKKNNPAGAISYAQKAIQRYDGDVELFILLAEAYLQLAQSIVIDSNKPKETEKRLTYLQEVKKFATRSVEIDPSNPEAQVMYARYTAVSQGVDTSISYINDLIKKFPYSVRYRLHLADVNKLEERFNIAAQIYAQVIEIDERNKKAYMGLAESERAMGNNSKALQSFLEASKRDPSDAEPILAAAQLLMEMNKYDDADRQIRRVIAINPNYPRAYFYLAKVLFAKGNFSEALANAKKEKEKNPFVADAYILTAEILFANKQYGECAAEYSQAIKLRPQSAGIYVKSAQCYRLADSLEIAEDMLSLAQSKESGFAEIYREQAAIFEKKGDVKSAVKAYDTYLELAPNAPDRAEVRFRLKRLGGG